MVYTFAEAHLAPEIMASVDERSKVFEDEESAKGVQNHYLAMLDVLERSMWGKKQRFICDYCRE